MMLSGTVNIGGHEWTVSEERRGGPQTQLISLTAVDSADASMQIRLGAGQEAKSLEDVGLYAADPAIRSFVDQAGLRWEARIVVHSEPKGPDRELVKFISDTQDVREGAYELSGGLGLRTDEELRRLLENAS
jgi:hypothetical protein